MKQLQKSDLKEGEIYKMNNNSRSYIFKATNNLKTVINVTSYNMFFKIGIFNDSNGQFFEATSEEKHWLETCIKADNFVSYEEAMKTFIPEYVECVGIYGDATINKVYNTSDEELAKKLFSLTWNQVLILYKHLNTEFRPSTKEAYDAQFVVKEPEFVLPEKWYIKIKSTEEAKIYKDFFKKVKPNQNWAFRIDFIYGFDGLDYNNGVSSGTYITFDQFKQYVLKENTTVTKEPKVVLEEPKDKVLQRIDLPGKGITIGQVQCSEGGIYKIGDKIKVFDKYSPNKGKPFIIKSFRWSNDKSKICVITELYSTNGIGLDKIELYVEPKVKQELSLLEQAKLKYIEGVKIKPTCCITDITLNSITLNNNIHIIENDAGLFIEGVLGWIYSKSKNKWAEIIDDFVLPENWYIKVTDDNKEVLQQYILNVHNLTMIALSNINYVAYSKWLNGVNKTENKLGYGLISHLNLNPLPNIYRTVTYYNGVEITFEQFKKYVLKDE